MSKPILLAVDDEPDVLKNIERDLRARYRKDYRVARAGSGAEALEVTRQLRQRGDVVALFLSDQRMPGMEGTEFLVEAQALFPQARTVLLTAYADTNAAIRSINDIGLDHYLMKPWDPPEQALYPVLDDLLDSWRATARPPYRGIQVAGALWSGASHDTKEFLARNRIPYRWLDVERDEAARALVDAVNGGRTLPVVFLPDGAPLEAPDRAALAAALGMNTTATAGYYDLLVIGGGPAGLGAAVYGASEGLTTALIEQEATGGQAGTSSRIENYLGFPAGLSGSDLAHRATTQAERLGAELLVPQAVTEVRLEGDYKIVTLADGTSLTARSLVLATGMRVRRLPADGVAALTGAGVYYGAALTEAAHYRGRPMFVVGGGNSAGQGAMFFSRYASKVTILIRRGGLESTMSRYLIEQLAATPNVEVQPRRQVVEAVGGDRLEALRVEHLDTGEVVEEEAAALFVFIGSAPNSQLVEGIVVRDDSGFVLTGARLPRLDGRPRGWTPDRDPYLLETSVPGVFAAGDVRGGSSKRVAAAVGEGAVVVSEVHQYLSTV